MPPDSRPVSYALASTPSLVPPNLLHMTDSKHIACDLLVVSTDSFLTEAQLTISRLATLGLSQRFDCALTLGEAAVSIPGYRLLRRTHAGTWSSELRSCLEQLDKPYVFLWLDDCIPLSITSSAKIVSLIDGAVQANADYLRLNAIPPGEGPTGWPGVSQILPGESYRTSTVFCVWKRRSLLALLDDDETAWEFEYQGSVRSDTFDHFYASDTVNVHYVNLVVKGLIDPTAEAILTRHGVDTSRLQRSRMNVKERFIYEARQLRARLFKWVPWPMRQTLREIFRRGLR